MSAPANKVTRTSVQVRADHGLLRRVRLRIFGTDDCALVLCVLMQLYRDCMRLAKHIGGKVHTAHMDPPSCTTSQSLTA
jgi:hypothetical protein